jgi:hypothetical protein
VTATEISPEAQHVVDLRVAPLPPDAPARTAHTVQLRRVDPWAVGRLSLVFYLCVSAVLLVAAAVLWIGAAATGVIANIEGFLGDAGFDGFRFRPLEVLRAATVLGLVLTVAGSLANILLAQLYNLLGDIVGGLRVTLTDEPPA